MASTKSSTSLVNFAYEKIRKRVLDNVWPPGYQALEQEVALALGMSRTPVREALIRLENDGLVEVVPRHGIRVLPVSPNEMREVYEILTALEGMAVEIVARKKLTRDDFQSLIRATADMDAALGIDDLEAWATADEAFHTELIKLAENKQLESTVLRFWDRAHRARMFSLRLRPKPINSTNEHAALLSCLLAGNASGAAAINRTHRERASRELLTIFEEYKLCQM